MVCLNCNLSLSRAEVGIIGGPPVRIRLEFGLHGFCLKCVLFSLVPEHMLHPLILELPGTTILLFFFLFCGG